MRDPSTNKEIHEEIPEPAELYFPTLRMGPKLAHYYGNQVRILFVGAAAALLILMPFLDGFSVVSLPFEVVGSIILVTLAALTHPKKSAVMLLNAVAAGVGIAVNELLALYAYAGEEMFAFMMREALAVVFVFALYFSMKTLRAMTIGQVGRREPPGEFLENLEDEREFRSRENRRTLWN